jgi:hypothetical protein
MSTASPDFEICATCSCYIYFNNDFSHCGEWAIDSFEAEIFSTVKEG